MIKSGAFPSLGGMAGSAILAELPIVLILLGMAGEAILWSALENVILVTVLAGNLAMPAAERESRQGVVKRGFFPGGGGMALGAVLSELASMGVIFKVACRACLGRSLQVCQAECASVAVLAGSV